MPIAGSRRIHRLTLRPAYFVASRLCSHFIDCQRACLLPALRLVGRGGSSDRLAAPLVLFNRIYGMTSAVCLPSPGTIAMLSSRHLLISSSRRAVPSCVSCLLASRLALPSHLMRLISSAIISPVRLPALRHGWRGVRRGASVLFLLGSALRFVPMSISRFMPFPLRCPLGLLACRIGCWCGRWRSHLVRAGCAAMSCLPVGSSRLSPRLSSRRSVRFLRLAPSCDTMGGASAVAVRLRRAFVPRSDFAACLVRPCLLASGCFSLRP